MLILRPDEQSYTALQNARKRQGTAEFWKLYAKRAGIEGTVAQAVRTCEIRRARYIGSRKLRLQAFLRRQPSMSFALSNGSKALDLLQHLFLALPGWLLLPNLQWLPS